MTTFFRFCNTVAEGNDPLEQVIRFTNDYILRKRLSYSYQNQFINGLKLFYREIMNKSVEAEAIQRPRGEHKLPNVLSKEEVKLILQVTRNLKHRTMLSLIYSCGLRRQELLNLKPEHVESKRGLLNIRQAKGNTDRLVPLSDKLIVLLRQYFRDFRPKIWLFEGRVPGEQYDERSIQQVLKKSLLLSGIKKM